MDVFALRGLLGGHRDVDGVAARLFTCRYGTLLSIGRVQTPTLAMIVQRDYDVKHFVKQKFFTVELDCGTFVASSERIDEEESAKNIAESCSGKTATISEIKKEIKNLPCPRCTVLPSSAALLLPPAASPSAGKRRTLR